MEATKPDSTIPTRRYQGTKKSLLEAPTKHIALALVGAVDGGKASFVSLLVNLLLGTEAHELIDQYGENDKIDDNQGDSPKTEITVHKVATLDGPLVEIFEFPDFGTKDDDLVKANVRKALEFDIEFLYAVVIVSGGEAPHLATSNLDAILDVIPRSCESCFGFMFPDSSKHNWKFKMGDLPSELKDPKHWLLENPLPMIKEYWRSKKERPDDKQAAAELRDEVESRHSHAIKVLDGWIKWVDWHYMRGRDRLREPFAAEHRAKALTKAINDKLRILNKARSDFSKAENEYNNAPEGTNKRTRLLERKNECGAILNWANGKFKSIKDDIDILVIRLCTALFNKRLTTAVNGIINMLEECKKTLGTDSTGAVGRSTIDEWIKMCKENLDRVVNA